MSQQRARQAKGNAAASRAAGELVTSWMSGNLMDEARRQAKRRQSRGKAPGPDSTDSTPKKAQPHARPDLKTWLKSRSARIGGPETESELDRNWIKPRQKAGVFAHPINRDSERKKSVTPCNRNNPMQWSFAALPYKRGQGPQNVTHERSATHERKPEKLSAKCKQDRQMAGSFPTV